MGGNLLLDIGPKSDGTIIPEQLDTLQGLGRWTRRNGEAIYGTRRGLPHGHFYGASTLSQDSTVLYLITFDRPIDGLAVKGIRNVVKSATVLGGGQVPFRKIGGASWAGLPGVLWLSVSDSDLDPDATVVRLELEGPLDLYSGHGDPVTFN